eukprot:TRINITY_DN2574_c0_g1_i5.p1 TRINITY_DN2574_c0_g1~~TRINITY_DN2574_c0_g1_i5.p1  ORF type:complete len:865 (-),score=177.51 TRINITY_DN2574_c0_g1_i5:60-2654(-)
MSHTATLRSRAERGKVRCVQFGILSPDAIRDQSVCEITRPESHIDGRPIPHGLDDPRMGVCDRTLRCQTCGGAGECPGHFAHIELAQPVYNIGLIDMVLKILRCVCYSCSKLLCDEHGDDTKFAAAIKTKRPTERFKRVLDCCRPKTTCTGGDEVGDDGEGHGGCGRPQPQYRKQELKVTTTWRQSNADDEEDRQRELSAKDAYRILSAISDEDCIKMGLNPKWARPEWFILTVFPVPPPPVRPSIAMDSGAIGRDDLTHKLHEVVKSNSKLKQQTEVGAAKHILDEFIQLLQYHCATFIDNEVSGLPQSCQRSGKPLKSVRQRLKGKQGRIRGNLMGKRLDFTARSVITPDPILSVDEVGVPKSIACNLTYPEAVTHTNLERMKQLVQNHSEHPGAKYIIRDDGVRIDLRFSKRPSDLVIAPGYKVERHIITGDYVMFNRQPSLHKMSIMAHKVRILQYSTFRLNLSCTSPYNADFDGDEMNMHVPQSHLTRAEAKEIMLVPRQIVSPQSNKPVMGIVQDTLMGSRKFTLKSCFMDKALVMHLLMWLPNWDGRMPKPAVLKPQELWTGKQLFSFLIPDPINVVRTCNDHDDKEDSTEDHYNSPKDTRVVIQQGELLCGIIDKKNIGAAQGGIVHLLWKDFGPDSAKRFLNTVQLVLNQWILQTSFTVGVADMIPNQATLENIKKAIDNAKEKVKRHVQHAQKGEMDRLPGMSLLATFEGNVNKDLNAAVQASGKLAKGSLARDNNVLAMVNSGSKGSHINISQMSACVGQQNVEGKRMPYGFKDRTLPHFSKNDFGPESRGFVENSYLDGLTPQEVFFHAMGGREGLVDTCLLYTSDAADEEDSVDLGGRRIIKKKKNELQVR